MVHSCTQGINIRLQSSFTTILFRGRIPLSTDHGALLACFEHLGNAKIHQNDMVGLVDHNIGGLYVPEDDGFRFVGVQVLKHITDLNSPQDHLIFTDRIRRLFENGFQIVSINELKHQVRFFFLGEKVIDFRD
ncbi:hypothetical protein SDC9_111408 [bioreactor metagenome]|uniref:Uncharacterized protein n=1 Tax=bioreactor metagenome TaxID=1076179 RepID=A0A645BIX8_9ZZZZ